MIDLSTKGINWVNELVGMTTSGSPTSGSIYIALYETLPVLDEDSSHTSTYGKLVGGAEVSTDYGLLTDSSAPSDWSTATGVYYQRTGAGTVASPYVYTDISTLSSRPSYVANTFYKYVVSYTLLTDSSAPSDWSSAFGKYYRRTGSEGSYVYTDISTLSSRPSYTSNTYYKKSSTGYERRQLNGSLYGSYIMNNAEVFTSSGSSAETYVRANNAQYIVFPESRIAWGSVAGFGLFTSGTGSPSSSPAEYPFLIGSFENPVSIGNQQVAIFREGQFEVQLHNESST